MSTTQHLAQFLADTTFEDLPSQVVDNTKLAIVDTIASALAGDSAPSVNIVRKLALDRGGKAESTLWGNCEGKVPTSSAAWVNGVLTDAMAFTESHSPTIAHLCGAIVPATTAVAERDRVAGKSLILSVALAYEAAGRIGKSISPDYMFGLGFHNAIVTIFGAAVGVGKILGLSKEPMTHAIALAATSASGLAGSRKTAARQYHGGNAAMQGLNAAMLAEIGYLGLDTILEHPEGYCNAFSHSATPENIVSNLGTSWEIVTELAPKLMPGSHGIHTVVEATLNAFRSGKINIKEITKIIVSGPQWKQGYALYSPRNVAEASHSIPYFVARTLLDGKLGWDALNASNIDDPATEPVQKLVEVVVDPKQPPYEYPGAATVSILTANNQTFSHTINHAIGTPEGGYSWQQIQDKYTDLSPFRNIPPQRIKEGLDLLCHLEEINDVTQIIPFLHNTR